MVYVINIFDLLNYLLVSQVEFVFKHIEVLNILFLVRAIVHFICCILSNSQIKVAGKAS
jgi:hypothetical protein